MTTLSTHLPLDLHTLKTELQSFFGDGLVTIIGSGLSCAEGLPGMGELASHILNVVGPHASAIDSALWATLATAISSDGLEAALLKHPPSDTVEGLIREAVADLIADRERRVIAEVFNGVRVLRLSRLIDKMLKPATGIPIVTTNYDRLNEVAIEEAGLGVDTLFFGQFAGRLDAKESDLSFRRTEQLVGRARLRHIYLPRAQVFKPHGSLDWYLRNGKPVRYAGDQPGATRLIITPGQNKFRNGYNSPFDLHRERANRAIDQASKFLVLGYGFNDDHLETHLTPAIQSGKPTLILTHMLSSKAQQLAAKNANVLAMEQATQANLAGTRVLHRQTAHFFPGLDIWDVNFFVSEVLEP